MLSVPVVDAHHHLWDPDRHSYRWLSGAPELLRRAHGLDELAPELELENVTDSVLVSALPSTEETLELLAVAETTPFVAGVVGWVDLTAAGIVSEIGALRVSPGGDKLVGLSHRVHDEMDPHWLLRADVRHGLAAVEAADLVFDLQVRTREMGAAGEVCAAFPGLRFVLDHLGRPPIASGDLRPGGEHSCGSPSCPTSAPRSPVW